MEAAKFKVGDTVRLNSDSPLMTVIGVGDEKINVVWFNFGAAELTFRDAYFPPAALRDASADSRQPKPAGLSNVLHVSRDPKADFRPGG